MSIPPVGTHVKPAGDGAGALLCVNVTFPLALFTLAVIVPDISVNENDIFSAGTLYPIKLEPELVYVVDADPPRYWLLTAHAHGGTLLPNDVLLCEADNASTTVENPDVGAAPTPQHGSTARDAVITALILAHAGAYIAPTV
jgi:hypothetical protein